MSFSVRYTTGARDDLVRLFQFLLDRARTVEDLDRAERALEPSPRPSTTTCDAFRLPAEKSTRARFCANW